VPSVADFPPVPLTLEGASTLHQMFRFRWRAWLNLDSFHRQRILTEAIALLAPLEGGSTNGNPNQSAVYSQLGHKADLMLLHFRDSFEELNQTEVSLSKLELAEYLEVVHSYLSVVELGLYESTSKTYQALDEKGFAPHSPEWSDGIKDVVDRQKAAMAPRLYPRIPDSKYLCFYPMDRRRGEAKNWYTVPMADRQRMMHEHGLIGRRYAEDVRQIITGSIGFDDWEWGVDLFAEDPIVFKKLIYEMRFDEVSAIYALFGAFYVGIRVKVADLGQLLSAPAGS
jgi:hydrogen peroxide-dependent heme synthase